MGLDPNLADDPQLIVMVLPLPELPVEWYREGRSACLVGVTRNIKAALDPQAKTGNYMNSVLAVAEKGLDYWNKFHLDGDGDVVLLSYDWKRYPENKKALPKDAHGAKKALLNCADWLVCAAVRCESFVVWVSPYRVNYRTKPGWRSSHAQVAAMQLLLRAYQLTSRDEYLNCAQQALQAFFVPVEQGGLTDKQDERGWWYAKFADAGCDHPQVLNGMLFALLGIYDFYRRTESLDAQMLFDKGMALVRERLPRYDSGSWSYYDRFQRFAPRHYHRIHIEQLEQLYARTGEPVLKDYAERFRRYERKGEENPMGHHWQLIGAK